jgi:hypothetical protein
VRVFLDANVFISALLTEGKNCATILKFVSLSEKYSLVISDGVIKELEDKFSTKFKVLQNSHSVKKFFAELSKNEIVKTPDTPLPGVFVRDPKDSFILAAAVEAGVNILISGDEDLLVLGTVGTTQIMKPRDFIDQFVTNL